MTRPSSGQRLSVYDFGEEDERVEKASEKWLDRFGNPKRKRDLFASPITKYTFLQSFVGGTEGLQEKEIIKEEKENINEPIIIDDGPVKFDTGFSGEIKSQCEEISDEETSANGVGHSHQFPVSSPMWMLQKDVSVNDIFCSDAPVLPSSSKYERKSSGMISDDDGRSDTGSSFVSISTLEENEEPVLESCLIGHKIDSLNNAVVVSADFILYKDIYCTESHLTFSRSCIRIGGSTVNGSKGTFNSEWAIGDVINIESAWCGRVETAMVSLDLKSKVSKGTGNANETSGIDKLKFSVCDPYWSEIQEAIKSLDDRYRDIWNVISDSDRLKDENDFTGSNDLANPKHYLYVLDETFDEIIYPKGDPDAVAISKRDVDLLQPETFINDTIIDFYVKFLKNKIQPEDQHRFHFFNSFFFRKLADLDKDPSSVCDGRAAFERVRKWTRKVNLFEKDYIFVPVNYSLHWSLIVICHPGEVAYFRDEESERAHKVPCILHMDSIRGSHRGLKNLIQSYLWEEWKERHNETLDDVSSKFSCLRFVPLELPQQENSFDCGLFLLHYLELFLDEVPPGFNPFKITQFSSFLNRNWFLPEEASLKRGYIQRLIYEILEDHSQKVPLLESIDKYPCSQFVAHTDEREIGAEFLEEKCSLKIHQGDSSNPSTELGIGISIPVASSMRIVQQQIKEPGLDSRESFKQGTSTRPFAYGSYTQAGGCRLRIMSPIEEAEETGEQISDSSVGSEDCRQIAELATESPTSDFGEDFRSLGTYRERNFLQVEDIGDDDSSSGSSICGSQKSSEIGVDEDHSDQEFEGFVHPKETDKLESSSTPIEDLTTYIVEDSEEESCMHNGNDPSPSDGESDRMDNIVGKENALMSDDNLVSESAMQAAKRPKLMSAEGGSRSQ